MIDIKGVGQLTAPFCIVGGRIEVDSEYGQGCSECSGDITLWLQFPDNPFLEAFRFFVKITACPSQKRALENDDDVPAEEEGGHLAKRRDTKSDSKIRVLVVEGEIVSKVTLSDVNDVSAQTT